MSDLLTEFIAWYLVVQLIALAALPLALRLFANLPDRGYAFSKSLGILLVGFVLWFGTSYGLMRNERGGAWLALFLVAALSVAVGWPLLRTILRTRRLPLVGGWRYVIGVELLFLVAFAGWAWVRAHDAAINHTEQPMDLMFMNGIWTSATYPPRDPWLAGYAISYYYFGYWILMAVARLAGQLPEIAYNLGQACWYGLLLVGSFGVGYNLLAAFGSDRKTEQVDRSFDGSGRTLGGAWAGGLLSAFSVGVIGNLQGILEWLYAQGVNVDGLAAWFNVRNFPAQAQVTGQWFIDNGWWWWRSSRVLRDTDLVGNHLEVIDEFPMFSYLLGDNHPHVLAMPFVLLVVALILNLFLARDAQSSNPGSNPGGGSKAAVVQETDALSIWAGWRGRLADAYGSLVTTLPLGLVGGGLLLIAAGGLIFLNTWDFPPYWLLLVLALFVTHYRRQPRGGRRRGGALPATVLLAVALPVGALLLYLPYFLTAQSQAGGFVPNLFNPTYFPQFFLMFGHFLFGVVALIGLAWPQTRPRWKHVGLLAAVVWGVPILFLAVSLFLANGTEMGRELLQRMPLPPEASGYTAAVLNRWLSRPFTFLIAGGLVAVVGALLWQRTERRSAVERTTTFALLMAFVGLLLVYAPEFVYLRDNFGTRMNTVFKFYYQGWLLLGLSSSYAIVVASWRVFAGRGLWLAVLPGALSFLLILGSLIYPVAGIYSKAGGFRGADPTLNGIAYVSADERAAIDWVRRNTDPSDIVLEGKGASYRADFNRISTASGRATLLGWDGHEAQWRGEAYGEMAGGRSEALQKVYRTGSPQEIETILAEWDIDYVYVGPAERDQYGIGPRMDARLEQMLDPVFAQGQVRIYQRRSPPSP